MSQTGPGKIYPITDLGNPFSRSHVELARVYLEAGIRFFQVREKNLADAILLDELQSIRRLCDRAGARFIVNDRTDLALASGADGVHLGQQDLPPGLARHILGPSAVIGLSTHNQDQLERGLREPVDYLALGPIYATKTKERSDPPVGLEELRRLSALCPIPLVAIGGISAERAQAVWEAGAQSVAVISDINGHPNPAKRILQYSQPTLEGLQ